MESEAPSERRGRTARSVLFALLLGVLAYGAGLGTGYVAFSTPQRTEPFEQWGYVNVVAGQEGVVQFAEPYRLAPNVELELFAAESNSTVVSECTPTGFRWKNAGQSAFVNSRKTKWVARGTR